MKKYIIILLGIILFIPNITFAKELNIYLFHGKTCPHCIELIDFLDEYLEDKDNIKLNKYEVWNNEDNNELFEEIKEVTNNHTKGVPYLIIGDKVIIGYSESSQDEIIKTINYYLNTSYEDKVANYIKNRNTSLPIENKEEIKPQKEEVINEEDKDETLINDSSINKNTKNVLSNSSNFFRSIILGLTSSFSISSIWILLFILSFITLYKDKNIKIMLSIIFIFILFISNLLYVSEIFDNTYLFDKNIFIRALLSIVFSTYGAIKVTRFINNKNDKNNKILTYSILSICFILMNILFIYSNLGVPTLFSQLSLSNNYLYVVIYSLSSVLLFTLLLILYIKISNLKWFKNKYDYFYIASCIILIVVSILVSYQPLFFF